MTVETCRLILKVHILAADSEGKTDVALALIAVLDAIDAENCASDALLWNPTTAQPESVDAPK